MSIETYLFMLPAWDGGGDVVPDPILDNEFIGQDFIDQMRSLSPQNPEQDMLDQILASFPQNPPDFADPQFVNPPDDPLQPFPGQQPPITALPVGVNPFHPFNSGGVDVNDAGFPAAGNPVGPNPFVPADVQVQRPQRPIIPPQFQGQGQAMPGAGNPGPMMNGLPQFQIPPMTNLNRGFGGQQGGNIFGGGQQGEATAAPQSQGNIYGGLSTGANTNQQQSSDQPQTGANIRGRLDNIRNGNVQQHNSSQILGYPRR